MEYHTLIVWAVTLGGLTVAGLRFYRRAKPMFSAPSRPRSDRPGERLAGVFEAVGLHKRLLQFRISGVIHLLVFTGFIVLFTAIIQAFGSGLFPGFTLAPIGGNTWIALLQDIFAITTLAGVALATFHRWVIRPERFHGSNNADATIIYFLITAIVGTMLMEFASIIAAGDGTTAPWRPVSSLIATGLGAAGIVGPVAVQSAAIFYWLHIAAILGFLIYIPGSKHRHMFLAAPNVFMRSLSPKGQLPAPPEERGKSGVGTIEEFTAKDMLDMMSCTECGRCQSVCPAHAAGLPLSPKTLIMDLRDQMEEVGTVSHQPLIGGAISEETLWACTTCHACVDVCPVHIEHVPKIVDMRRQMIEDGNVEPMLQDALANLQRTGNSQGKPGKARARWTKGLPFKIKDARKEPVDILWFVGDFASYDARVQRITKKVAELLHTAGVNFGILYDAEQNSGNDVRRAGEEGLFEMLAQHNVEILGNCSFNRIMTTDPHTLNALRQEYTQLGAHYDVVHYAELIAELLEGGRLNIKTNTNRTVTYHDPCYLGRYNGEFDAPREIIRQTGSRLIEMGRCRENSFCCGAGGGRIWMDDSTSEERPSENRIREALALGTIDAFVVACPKDTVMYSAAVQNLGVQDRLEVLDIVDLIEVSPDLNVDRGNGQHEALAKA